MTVFRATKNKKEDALISIPKYEFKLPLVAAKYDTK